MKSMALTGVGRMGMIERPEPRMDKDTDVMIRLMHMGVCGSDLHLYNTGEIGGEKVIFPFVIGHEGSGIVEEVGKAVTRVKKGDIIAIEPAMPCGDCDQCNSNRRHTCRNLRFLGNPDQSEGLLSEFIVMPENSCYALPEGMDPRLGCFAEPLSIGIYAVELAGSLTGKNIAILGSGPIGMCVLLYAKTAGVSGIYSTDLIDERLQLAEKAGSIWTGNTDKEDTSRRILERVPEGIDIIFECCGKQEALDQAIAIARPGGKILIVGIPEFNAWKIPVDTSRRKELNFQNVRRQNECMQKAIDLLHNGSINAELVITHDFPFYKTDEAFELVSSYRDGVMKALVNF